MKQINDKVLALYNALVASISGNMFKVTSNGTTVSSSTTRPNDTTAYTALDVVGTSPVTNIEFANVTGVAGSSVIVTGVALRIDVNAVPSGMTGFRLHLYDSEPTAIADNSAFNLPSGDRSKYIGYIDIDTPIDMGDTLYIENLNVNKQVKTVTTSIYGILQTMGAFTPSAQTVKTIKLRVVGV